VTALANIRVKDFPRSDADRSPRAWMSSHKNYKLNSVKSCVFTVPYHKA
jgi:hypothetical protein